MCVLNRRSVYFRDIDTLEQGIGTKLGMCLQWITCFVVCYIFCFIRGWKLTLVILPAMPVIAGLIGALRWVGIEPVIAGLTGALRCVGIEPVMLA